MNIQNQNPDRNYDFWHTHGGVGLVWSNPHASDSVMIKQALLKPSFHRLLEIAAQFGLDRLKTEWEAIQKDMETWEFDEEKKQFATAELIVKRCLHNMEEGLRQTA